MGSMLAYIAAPWIRHGYAGNRLEPARSRGRCFPMIGRLRFPTSEMWEMWTLHDMTRDERILVI